ncbi:hypothetical protein CCACVL1_22831 [Corchorus capsularis]|uniref:FAF domain-containing protein n=1 Tax=Corchorus capsularis TaxID=210143 RepID=A0A1R3GWG6_COCAP|nr:hypothetical protein CCACVL1_22831 [Corchorus capsularis]
MVDSSPPSKCGLLGLIANETPRVPNVIESSSVIIKPTTNSTPPPPRPPSPLPFPPSRKKDPGGIGFIDDIGGGVDGLMSCTESLGFESCDERRVDDDDGDHHDDDDHCHEKMMGIISEGKSSRDAWRKKRSEEKKERNNKKFPPPLSSLNQNGQPCFYLKPVRENGRLELTEVRIQRPEVLRAVRQNGRLRLHLVSSDDNGDFSIINEEEEDQEEIHQLEITKQQELQLQEEVKVQEEEQKVEEIWNYRVNNNGEGFRRCHELVMSHHHHLPNINDHHHHHHSLHVWRQPCVTR